MAKRYIPKPGDRFKVFVLSKTEEPTDYERRQLQAKTKYYGRPARGADNCLCLRIQGNAVIAKNGSNKRAFNKAEFFFIKKPLKASRVRLIDLKGH